MTFYNGFLSIILTIGGIWLRSSSAKLSGGVFVNTLEQTLIKFASNNPYLWYKQFLQSTAIPNAKLLALLIMWGELLVALSVTCAAILLFFKPGNKTIEIILLGGLIGGLILNTNFYFAAGWTSPSTESVNLLMAIIEVIAIVAYGSLLAKKL